jgi:hypothetical protein
MFNFDSDCEECNQHGKQMQNMTGEFLLKVVKHFSETSAPEHMPAPAVLLIIMDAISMPLRAAIEIELDVIGEDSDTKEEAEKRGAEFVDHCVDTCFSIMEDALPVEIHAHGDMSKEDTGTVLDIIDGLKAKRGDNGATH